MRLWQEGGEWKALLDGAPYTGDIYHLWVWSMGHPISRGEYNYLLARGHHAKRWQPEHPAANPSRPVYWLSVTLPRGRK